MAKIAFLGLGNMGAPMAHNLVAAGHEVRGFDPAAAALAAATQGGVVEAASPAAACDEAEVVFTMLPAGQHVREAYLGERGILTSAPAGTLLIDCSTIDVAVAREVHQAAAAAGFPMLDAPVSGGVAGAEAGTLTMMVGGPEAAFEKAGPYLDVVGGKVVHAGPAGNGQAAKVCNNMMLGISMIAVSEAFNLAEQLGLDPQKLFEISSVASGSCWAMLNHHPLPGIVPTSAANRDYKPGFATAMMHKDLKLAQAAAANVNCATPLGAEALQLYSLFVNAGHGGLDYSAIIRLIRGELS